MAVNYEGTALVLNCGSSSVKYQVIDTTQEEPLAKGLVERVTDHTQAVATIIADLSADDCPVDVDAINVVGHRVVQGGAEFVAPTIITDDVERGIAMLSTLAPLHNPGHVAGISAARLAFPNLPHVAVFDTAFHQTMPEAAYTYAIDRRVAEEHGVRKYGFHGTSHGYVARECAEHMGRPVKELSIVTLHLGNGASACAVKGGRSVDTSMGLTPLEGLVMGTRSGDIDPAVTSHLTRTAGMTADEVDALLNRQSGMLGLCGHPDMREAEEAAAAGDPSSVLAMEVYNRRIRGYVGKYWALMGGLDAIVFTAGVGENSDVVRAGSMAGLEGMGVIIDAEANAVRSKQARKISTAESKVEVWVVPTDEEREIALQSVAAVR